MIDRIAGDLLARVSADTDVIVVSDHGWEYDGTEHMNNNPGVFIAAGPSFAAGRVEDVSVLDVTPLVLASRGVPLSRTFEGEIPAGVLTDRVLASVEYVADYGIPAVALPEGLNPGAGAPPEDDRMLELLRDLGYIE